LIDYLNHNETKALLNEIAHSRDLAIVSLFLNTGIFLNELTALQISDIDWKTKQLNIKGNRARKIALNEDVFNTLAQWSQDRIDSDCTAFFTTTKGKIQPLSDRSVDHLIRKYATKARLNQKVNAHILRNTFAIRLCQTGTKKETLKSILGLIDSDVLKRYQDAAKAIKQTQPLLSNEPLDALDNRSWFTKKLQSIWPTQPKIAKPLKAIDGIIEANPKEIMFGRDAELKKIRTELERGQSILITGQIGLGKTHFLKHLETNFAHAIFIPSPTPIKQMLEDIIQGLGQKPDIPKASVRSLLNQIIHTPKAIRPILIIDDLAKLKQPDIDPFLLLLDHFTILAATDTMSDKLKIIWWKFQVIELEPLDEPTTKNMIRYLTQNLPISDYQMLQTKLLSLANGNPLAITDMVKHLRHRPVVSRQVIRDLYHDAGIRYREWSNMLIIFWALLIMSRFIALGTHSFEAYILAGFGTSIFMVLKYFVQRMK